MHLEPQEVSNVFWSQCSTSDQKKWWLKLQRWMLHYQGQKQPDQRNGLQGVRRASEAKVSEAAPSAWRTQLSFFTGWQGRLCFVCALWGTHRKTDSLPPFFLLLFFASIKLISGVGSWVTEDCFEMTNILTAWEKEALEEEYLWGRCTRDISAVVIVILHSYDSSLWKPHQKTIKMLGVYWWLWNHFSNLFLQLFRNSHSSVSAVLSWCWCFAEGITKTHLDSCITSVIFTGVEWHPYPEQN